MFLSIQHLFTRTNTVPYLKLLSAYFAGCKTLMETDFGHHHHQASVIKWVTVYVK